MRRDVPFAGVGEPGGSVRLFGVGAGRVHDVALERGERPRRVAARVQRPRRVAVVDQEDEAPRQAPGRGPHPVGRGQIDLAAPPRLRRHAEPFEAAPESRARRRPQPFDEPVAVDVHEHLAQAVDGHRDGVGGQGVEQLVGENHSRNPVRQVGGAAVQAGAVPAQGLRLARPRGRARLHQGQPHCRVQFGMSRFGRVEHVAGELTVAGAGLDEVDLWAPAGEQPAHLVELGGQQRAELRADVHARIEVAGASRPPARAGVVAQRRVVQRQLHERRHRQRSTVADAPDDQGP